jgi:DNA-binding GntR family transcriptional regulator
VTSIERPLPEEVFTRLDREGPVPLYAQVAERFEALIADGTLPSGTRLENEIAMGERFGLSRPTMRRAIQVLVDKGLLVRRRGVGTQIVHGSITRRAELSSLYDDLAQDQRTPTTEVLLYEMLEPTVELAQQLGVEIERPVLHLKRLRSADDAPIALMENHLLEAPLVLREELERRGLYEMLRERGTTMRVARQFVSARAAIKEEARLLDVPVGSPILTLERTAYDQSGRVVEIGHTHYRPDRYTIEFTLVEK